MLPLTLGFSEIEAQDIAFAPLAFADPDFFHVQVVGDATVATRMAQHLGFDLFDAAHRHRQHVATKAAAELGEGERRKRYVLCFNPAEAERQRLHRAEVLAELESELRLLAERREDHPKAACALMASRRWGRYLSPDRQGRPKLDAAKVKAAEKFDGKWVVITNDDTLTAEDVALAYKGGMIIESCFRRMKQTGLEVRPMYHWMARRIEAHVKLCVLALQVQRAAEIRTGLPWARIAHALSALKAVRYGSEGRTIVQRTKSGGELADLLKKLGISIPKQLLAVTETAPTPATA